MNVTLPNGKVIKNVPEGTTKQQIMQKAIAAGLASEADFGVRSNLTEADIPLGMPAAQQQPVQQQPTTAFERFTGAAENVAANTLGVPLSLAGQAVGSVYGIGEAISQGKYGTMEGADLAQSRAEEFAQRANIFAPRTQAGQEIAQAVGKQLEPLSTLPPVLPGAVPALQARAARPVMPDAQTPKAMQEALDINRGSENKALAAKMTTPQEPMVVVKDPIAKQAISLGASEKLVQTAKTLSPSDKKKVSQMLDVIGKGEDELLYSKFNRPSDIVGDSLKDRITYVKQVNKTAGQEIDRAAEKLRGQQIDVADPVNGFISALEDMGVTLDKNNVPKFKGSDIEGFGADEKIVAQVVGRMRETRAPDAYDVHRLKRYIDRNVTYGKSAEGGVSPQTVSVLKQLRANLDGLLDAGFDDYNKANVKYSDTIRALDDMQTSAGKIDLLGEGSERALGARSRALLSNQQKRIDLENAIRSVDEVAKKYNGKFDDDIMSQVAIVDELERMFNVRPATSIGGEMSKTAETANQLRQNWIETTINKSAGLFRKSEDQRRKEALASLRKLMARGEK